MRTIERTKRIQRVFDVYDEVEERIRERTGTYLGFPNVDIIALTEAVLQMENMDLLVEALRDVMAD